jgi:hypothetical protein
LGRDRFPGQDFVEQTIRSFCVESTTPQSSASRSKRRHSIIASAIPSAAVTWIAANWPGPSQNMRHEGDIVYGSDRKNFTQFGDVSHFRDARLDEIHRSCAYQAIQLL